MDRAKLEFLRGTLDVLILKALVWGPLHGYAITNFIRQQSDHAFLIEEGTLYPALWRLESRGLLAAEWGLSENNRKRLRADANCGRKSKPGKRMHPRWPRCSPPRNCQSRRKFDDDSLLAPLRALLRF